MTESGPFGIFVTNPHLNAGVFGLPAPGLELKRVDIAGRTEVSYRGPNITPGYWRATEETAQAFDEDGFFRTSDAVRWIDPANVHLGLKFDGTIAEDIKLATATLVRVGPLRTRIIAAGAPYVQDAVITGVNGKEVGAMIFPTAAVRQLSELGAYASTEQALATPAVLQRFQELVDHLAATSNGTANRVARLCLLAQAPSLDQGEITDKGSINQKAVLRHRASLVAALHDDTLAQVVKPMA
jgi:feruloyl-CoA synthase